MIESTSVPARCHFVTSKRPYNMIVRSRPSLPPRQRGQTESLAIAGADRQAHREARALLWEETVPTLANNWKISLKQLGTSAKEARCSCA